MAASSSETGTQLLARLGTRPSLQELEPAIFIGGGPKPKDVIEFYGESSTGKTQCLIHLIAKCILPSTWRDLELKGLGVGVVYIDNNFHFSLIRLVGILENRVLEAVEKGKQVPPNETEMEDFIKICLDKLLVVRCSKSSQFVVTLHSLETSLSNRSDISLIVIDSISTFYWIDRHSGGDNQTMQEKNLRLACEAIEKLVSTFQIVLIATKAATFQKRAKFQEDSVAFAQFEQEQGKDCVSTEHFEFLCKAWQRLVTQRYIFSTLPSSVSDQFSVTWNQNKENKVHQTFQINDTGLVFTGTS